MAILLIMNEKAQKAFDFAADVIKQLITLATGIIAVTITFSKDIIGASMLTNSSLIFYSWGFFLFSIMAGIWALLALTGNLQPITPPARNIIPSINTKNVRIPMFCQIGSFVFALFLTILFGIKSIKQAGEISEDKNLIKKEIKNSPENKKGSLRIHPLRQNNRIHESLQNKD